MKVLHITETVVGGIASYLDDVVSAQVVELGMENVRVLVPVGGAAHLPNVPAACVIETNLGRRLSQTAGLLRRIRSTIDAEHPALVHAHSSFAGIAVRLVVRSGSPQRPRIVYCSHGWAFLMGVPRWRRCAYLWVERLLASRADRIVNVSRFEHEQAVARGIPADRCALVPHGVHTPQVTEPLPTLSDQWLNLLFAGRLDYEKGFDLLVRAMRQLENLPIHLFVAGGSVRGRVRLAGADAATNVTYLGWLPRERLAGWYAAVDAVVVPSRWEAFGLVAAEAMSHGTPVVASDAGALPEVVGPAAAALFRTGDSRHLAEVLGGLDRASLRELGQRARVWQREHYDLMRANRALMALYQELTEGAPGRSSGEKGR